MDPLKEEILLNKMDKAGYSVSFSGVIPNVLSDLTEDWLSSNVTSKNKALDLATFIQFWHDAEKDYIFRRYVELRRIQYPSIQDQLDMLYWDKINGTNKWQEAIDEVKKQFPKNQ